MGKEHYASIIDFYAAHPGRRKLLELLCRLLPWVVAGIYALVLVRLWISRADWLIQALVYPLLTLLAVALLRRAFPRPRPYDRYAFTPLMGHDGGGSFPSRHTASAAIIALTAARLSPVLGAAGLLLALAVGITRILAGLHFPRDILGGFLLALAVGLPGFF